MKSIISSVLVCSIIVIGALGWLPAANASNEHENWGQCKTHSDCVTTDVFPCHFNSVNTRFLKEAEAKLMKMAALVDCRSEDLDKKRNSVVTSTHCDTNGQCAHTLKAK
jgi:hypothetical protein